MPIATHRHPLLAWMLERRCLLLFLAIVALLIAVPFLSEGAHGPAVLALVNVIVLLTAVAAVGRTRFSFVIAVLLVVPALVFRLLALAFDNPGYQALSWGLGAVFYAFILVDLLYYVLRRDLMTEDKLYGAVAAYMLVAIFWANLAGVVQYFYPGAYALDGTPKHLDMTELIYFSFTALTTAGFGDITPCWLNRAS